MADFRIPEFLELDREILGDKTYLQFQVKKGDGYFLLESDIIKVEQIDVSQIKSGDLILAYTLLSELIPCRVIKKIWESGEWVFITKGDYNLFFNEKIYPQDVLGKIVAIERAQEEIKINTYPIKLRVLFYNKILILQRLLGKVVQKVQSLKIYGCIAKKILSKEKIVYRIATPEDALSLARLFRRRHWSTPLKINYGRFYDLLKGIQNSGCCFLAQKGDKVIGVSIAKRISQLNTIPCIWLFDKLYVDLFYRNLGIGEQLGKLMVQEIIKRGADQIKGISALNYKEYASSKLQKTDVQLYLQRFGISVFIDNEVIEKNGKRIGKRASYTVFLKKQF